MTGPLEGLRVVELAGPYVEFPGKLLADMGADVVAVEPPDGSPSRQIGPFAGDDPGPERSLHFWHYNTSKRSVTLDLATRQGRGLWLSLVQGADVVLEGAPPGRLDELGVGWEALSIGNPGLVMASVSPWGPDGPYADYASGDLVQMAMGGIVASCGYSDHDIPPVRPGENHSLHITGWHTVIGILAALRERDRSGAGQHAEVAVHDCVGVCTEFAASYWFYARQLVGRQTARHAMPVETPRSIYPARGDDRWVLLSALNEDVLEYFAAWAEEAGVDLAQFRDEDGKLIRGPELREAVQRITAIMESEEIWLAGQSLGMTWAAIRPPEEWLDDPHTGERGFFHEVTYPPREEPLKYPGPPYAFTEHPGRIGPAPLLGEHNAEVYGSLGYTAPDLTALREAGAV